MRNRRPSSAKWVRKLLPALFWTAIWIIVYCVVRQELLLAAPWQVLKQFAIMREWQFWAMVASSLGRSLLAYLLGVTIGGGLAIGCSIWPLLDDLMRPALRVIRATPVSSFIILALVWLSSAWVPLLTGTLMVTPVMYANCREGIASTDKKLLEMSRMFHWSKVKTWHHVILPSTVPTFLAACEACIGLCFKAVIAAEVLGVPKNAVGTAIYHAKIYLETDRLMMWTFVVVLMSMGLEWVLKQIVRGGRRHDHPTEKRMQGV